MRKLNLFPFLFFAFSLVNIYAFAQCGLYEISLTEKVAESTYIIEGEVEAQQCFKASKINKIFTLNTIKVYSVLKGNLPQKIYLITAGGKLGNQMEKASSLLSLQVGQVGMFFLNQSEPDPASLHSTVYAVYSSSQGFYIYNLSEQLISNVFNQYTNIGNQFYQLLESEYGLKAQVIYFNISWTNSSLYDRLTVINNFSPSTVNAGVGDEITINGFGFGSSRGSGKVFFKNSDDGGATEIAADAQQYKSWIDNKIVVAIPQKAGTGKIAVDLGATKVQSNAILKVNYAIINTGSNELINPARLVAKNSNRGYIWNMNVDFNADSIAKSNFLISFKKWRCSTYINWSIGRTVEINRSESDTINVITFDENNELPAGVLGLCYSYYSGCAENDWYVEESDMLFRKSDKWHFGDGAIPFNKIDFQSVALHELGHAHQIGHVINNLDLMHYSISLGVQKRNIEALNLEAAQWMINKSEESNICDKKRMQLLDSDLCNDELFGFYNTVIYPNPFYENFNIDFYLNENSTLKVVMYDVTGKLVAQYENNSASKGYFPLVFDFPSHQIRAGVYILKIEVGGEKSIKKLIKY